MLDQVTIPRLVVAGMSANSGKTTVACGLTAALMKRGRTVQTFKAGADLLDCAYLSHASRRPCRNLDAWMLGEDGVRRALARGVIDADCAIVDGVMGLFDGHSMSGGVANGADGRLSGSTAELARLIAAPVVLVLDVSLMGETAAAVALGLKSLDPRVNCVGVILNNVPAGQRRKVVEDAVWELARLPVLGAFPRIEVISLPALRTGLLPVLETPDVDEAIDQMAASAERHCDLDLIERLMARAKAVPGIHRHRSARSGAPEARIGVAFDDAFCSYYAENLEALQEAGAEIVPFSPVEDAALPPGLDALYFGAGVSEVFVPRLAANQAFIRSLRRAHAHGLLVYAESGGVVYIARTVRTSDGATFQMAGLVPVDLGLQAGSYRTGYREVRLANNTWLGPSGTRLRGHEFHFTQLLSRLDALAPLYTMHDTAGEPLGCEGWAAGNLVASFVHLHFEQNESLPRRFVESARAVSEQRRQSRIYA